MSTTTAHETPLSIKAMFLLKGHCIFAMARVKVGNMKNDRISNKSSPQINQWQICISCLRSQSGTEIVHSAKARMCPHSGHIPFCDSPVGM